MTAPNPADLTLVLPALLEALGHAGSGVLVVGDEGGSYEFWYVNEPAAAMFGYSQAAMLAMSPIELMVPEQRPLIRQLSAAFRGGQPVPPTLEFAALHKNGGQITIEFAMGYHRVSNTTVAYVVAIRDVSKATSQLTLLEADRIGLVGALSAGFAHEINNPLTSVLLNLRSLRKYVPPDSAQATRCIDDITTGAERIASNVRALQRLATRSASQEIDLASVVSAALRLAAPTLEPCAHVVRQISSVSPVLGEESRVGQAVLAMMLFSSSGFEITSPRNRITVAVEQRGHDVTVEVSDNGHELSAEETRRAFDPFFRSPSRGAGVGVGLGVARSVAATLGGEVTLAARPGGGAVITMRLPAAPK